MIHKSKYVLLYLSIVFAVSMAAEQPLQVQQLHKTAQQVEGWLWLGAAVPLIQGKAQLKNPVTILHSGLLRTDTDGRLMLVAETGKDRIDYQLYGLAGKRAGGFRVLRDMDLPLPAAEMDARQQQIFLMEPDGRIGAYDYRGQTLWATPAPGNFDFTYENTYFHHWNAAGQILFTAYSAPLLSGKPGFGTLLRAFDGAGRLLARRLLPERQVLKLVYNDQKRQKVLLVKSRGGASSAKTLLLGKQNSVIWEKNYSFRRALFLGGTQILLVQKRTMILVDDVSGQRLRQFNPAAGAFLIADVLFDGSGNIVVVCGKPFYAAGKLRYADPILTVIRMQDGDRRKVSLNGKVFLPRALYLTEDGAVQMGCRQGLYQIRFK